MGYERVAVMLVQRANWCDSVYPGFLVSLSGLSLKFSDKSKRGLSPNLIEHLGTIEEFHSLVAEVPQRLRVDISGVVTANRSPVTHVGHALWHLYVVQCEKYAQCLAGTIRAFNDQEYLVTGLCCRAFMEHAAALRHVVRKLERIARDASNPDEFTPSEFDQIINAVDQLTRGGRFNWERYYSDDQLSLAEEIVAADKSRGRVDQPNPNSLNIKTAIDDWAREHAGVALIYAFLCELVHPNIGSTFLVVGDDQCPLAAGGGSEKTLGRKIAERVLINLLPIVKEASRNQALVLFFANSLVQESEFIDRT